MTHDFLTKEFDKLKDKFSSIQHYQRLVDRNTSDILKQLSDELEDGENLPKDWKGLVGTSVNNFFYPDPTSGKQLLYSHKKTSIQETIKLTYLFKNKQYQWLLSEAYEAFEDFIETIYAICGAQDIEFWHQEHRQKLPPNPDSEKLRETAKGIRIAKILNRMRSKVPSITAGENGNSALSHIKFYLVLIEKLRHIIVHANGVTSNKEKVIIDILHASNESGDKEVEPIARKAIANYFGTDEYSNHVYLLEHREKNLPGLVVTIQRQEYLANKMLSYSHLVVTELLKHFDPV